MPARVGGRTGWTPRHLVLKDAPGEHRRLRALLPEVPQPGRVRVRPRLGRRLRAGGRATTIPSCRSPCPSRPCRAGACWCGPDPTPSRTRRCSPPAAARARRAQRHLGRAHHLPQRGRMGAARRAAASSSAPTSSSTGAMPATAPSTTFWPRSPRASARPCARSASRRWRRASTIEWVRGREITEAHWDAFFAFYMDTGSRKWGRPYLNRKVVLADRRQRRGRALPADAGQARQARRSPARST